jgi:hypothetical protein
VKLGIVGSAIFVLLIAGPNVPNPMLPVYVHSFALTPLAQSAMFSSYIGAMVAVLTVLSAGFPPKAAVRLLAASAALMVAADIAMLLVGHGVSWMLLGRVLSGLSVGMGTGPAAAIVLMALGERGRTVVASGSVAGSLLGNLGAGVVATYVPDPTMVAYLAHGLITLIALFGLLKLWRPNSASTISGEIGTAAQKPTSQSAQKPSYRARHRVAGYLLGGLAWTAAGAVLALLPTAVRGVDPNATLLVAIAPACMLLAFGSVAQLVTARAILRLRAWHVLIPLLVGTALAALSLEARSYPGLLVACTVIGLGQGPGYTLGLATVTHGRPPHLQGKATSRYAAAAYGVCAAAVVAIGAAASAWGLVGALFATTAVFAVVGAIAVAAAGRPQNWASVAV